MIARLTTVVFVLALSLPGWSQVPRYGSPSILPQCLDTAPSTGYGPSSRARECTRQYCARPEYQAIVEAYALSRPFREEDQKRALICITRKEQDLKEK
jgi:hypothetical protein